MQAGNPKQLITTKASSKGQDKSKLLMDLKSIEKMLKKTQKITLSPK